MVYVTEGLAMTLLRLAEEADPQERTIRITVTDAADLPADSVPDDAPVFTHFYMPEAGGSLGAVFGFDLGTPVGQSEALFVSHPRGELTVTREDDLHEVVLVAVPPWTPDDLAAFDRSARRLDLELLDIEPPEEALPGETLPGETPPGDPHEEGSAGETPPD